MEHRPAARNWPWALLLAILAGLAVLSACAPDEEDWMSYGTVDTTPRAIPPIDLAIPVQLETATFALGWFWGPDSRFGSLPGVIRTRVGYAGGTWPDPTYYDLADHSETIQIDYDPTVISYQQLLQVYWDSHNPVYRPGSRQYASIIFYHDEAQRRLAEESMAQRSAQLGRTIYTEIVPYRTFYLAEDYHQKYMLRSQSEILRDFQAIYADTEDFVNSTAVARVNGFLGGNGSAAELEAIIDQLGLSHGGEEKLRRIVGRRL